MENKPPNPIEEDADLQPEARDADGLFPSFDPEDMHDENVDEEFDIQNNPALKTLTSDGYNPTDSWKRKLLFAIPVISLALIALAVLTLPQIFNATMVKTSHVPEVIPEIPQQDPNSESSSNSFDDRAEETCDDTLRSSVIYDTGYILGYLECALLYGDEKALLETTGFIYRKLVGSSEYQINSDPELAELLTMFSLHLFLIGRSDLLENLERAFCKSTTFTPTCVTDLLASHLLDDRLKVESLIRSATSQMATKAVGSWKSIVAWVLFRHYRSEKPKFAAKALNQSIRIQAKKKPVLLRLLYETQIFELIKGSRSRAAAKQINSAKKLLTELPESVSWKIGLYEDLNQRAKGQLSLKKVLTKSIYAPRIFADRLLLENLGYFSLKQGLANLYLSRLTEAKAFLRSRYSAAQESLRTLDLWEIRAQIAMGQFELASQKISNYEKTYGAGGISSHLKGVVLMNLSPNAKYQMLAAESFATSLEIRPSWETYHGLAVALIRSNQLAEARSVYNKMRPMIRSKSRKFWNDMLKSELHLKGGQPNKSLSVLSKYKNQSRFRNSRVVSTLSREAFKQLGNIQARRKVERSLERLESLGKQHIERERQISPIDYFGRL